MNKTEKFRNCISVAMISNAMSHHQQPFCDAMYEQDEVKFYFIATKPIAQDRLNMGYSDLNKSREYIIRPYESEEEKCRAFDIANKCDFVIYGSAPFEYIKSRIKKKWTFIYSERLFKETRAKDLFNIKTIVACIIRYAFKSHKKLRLLCSSAYASADFKFFGFKEKHALKWGYYPPISSLNYEEIKQKKQPLRLVWVGRFIHWKHPELAVELAKKLLDNNIDFSFTMIGNGVMYDQIKALADTYKVADRIKFMGALSTKQTREEMEKAQILITTSDHNEGWGAIVNEGMSSGCAVVASHLMGSVPYLIKDKENGFIFESGNADDLYDKVKTLLTNDALRETVSKNAYESIDEEYNGSVAANRLVAVMREYLKGNENFAFESGICSVAKRMKNSWYKG